MRCSPHGNKGSSITESGVQLQLPGTFHPNLTGGFKPPSLQPAMWMRQAGAYPRNPLVAKTCGQRFLKYRVFGVTPNDTECRSTQGHCKQAAPVVCLGLWNHKYSKD